MAEALEHNGRQAPGFPFARRPGVAGALTTPAFGVPLASGEDAMTQDVERPAPGPSILWARLAIGLAQGLALFGLHKAFDAKVWPATNPAAFWPLVLSAAFVPLLILGGLSTFRRGALIAWAALAAALTIGLAHHDIVRQFVESGLHELQPSASLSVALVLALFVAHHLIAAADQERRLVAPYAVYFDVAWKDGVQLAMTCLFVGVFWAVLRLGALLFGLIGIKTFGEIIAKDWFAIHATTLVFAGAVHLTDVRASLIRGVRTVALALLSWLMPLMALIAVAFIAALPFTGLKLLWATKASTAVLLWSAAVLVLLINAAYQDGDLERRPPFVLRGAGRLAAGVLVPIIGVAAYGLWLRIGQYGWTPERIMASACVLIGSCYALGYVAAALSPGRWLGRLETTNIATGVIIIVVIIALFTPIADPARIATADQVGRLEAGKIAPDKFDFNFLRFKAARYGMEALRSLKAIKSGPNAAVIAGLAADALKRQSEWEGAPASRPLTFAAKITVYPKGAVLPESLLRQNWAGVDGVPCLPSAEACDAFFVDLDGDGTPEVLLGEGANLQVFQTEPGGAWKAIGSIEPINPNLLKGLREGRFKTVRPRWQDLDVDGHRARLSTGDREDPMAPSPPSAARPH